MDLLDQIGRELQSRFTFGGIDEFLSACGIKPLAGYSGPNSKWAYAKTVLKDVTDSTLLEIAAELELKPIVAGGVLVLPPRNWQAFYQPYIERQGQSNAAKNLSVCLCY
jgi:hypothetical protein